MFGFSRKEKAMKSAKANLDEAVSSVLRYSGFDVWRIPDEVLTPFNIQVIQSTMEVQGGDYSKYDYTSMYFFGLAVILSGTDPQSSDKCLSGLNQYLSDNKDKISPKVYKDAYSKLQSTMPKK